MDKLYEAARKLQLRKQRQEDRLHREIPAELKIISLPNGGKPPRQTIKCLATNISLSGTRIALATFSAIEVGTVARIKLKCSLMKSFTFEGIANNARRDIATSVCFAGFKISSDDEKAMGAWHEYIAKHFQAARARGE